MSAAAVIVQTHTRRYLAQIDYWQLLNAIVIIQCYLRMIASRKVLLEMRQQKAATIVQTSWRKYVAKRSYIAAVLFARCLQRVQRGRVDRRRATTLRARLYASFTIQRSFRCYRARVVRTRLNSAHIVQRGYRCFKARRVLKALKMEARDLKAIGNERNALKIENQELMVKVEALKSEIEDLHKQMREENEARGSIADMEGLRAEAEDSKQELKVAIASVVASKIALSESEAQSKELELEVEALNEKISRDSVQREEEMAASEVLREELESIKLELSTEKDQSTGALASVNAEIVQLKSNIEALEKDHREAKAAVEKKDSALAAMENDLVQSKSSVDELKQEIENIKLEDKSTNKMNGYPTPLATAAVATAARRSSDTTEELSQMRKELENAKNENQWLKSKLAVASVPAAAITSKMLHETITQSTTSSLNDDEMQRLKDELDIAKSEVAQLRSQGLGSSNKREKPTKSGSISTSLEIEMLKSALEASNKQNIEDKESYQKALADANKEISILQSKVVNSPQSLDGTFAPPEKPSTDPMVSVLTGKLQKKDYELDTIKKMLDEAYTEAKDERSATLRVWQVMQAVMLELDAMREESNKLTRLLVQERRRSRKFKEMIETSGNTPNDDESSVSSAWLWNSTSSVTNDKDASSMVANRNWNLALNLSKASKDSKGS